MSGIGPIHAALIVVILLATKVEYQAERPSNGLITLPYSRASQCIARDTLTERLARRLLIAQNRIISSELRLTHELLALAFPFSA
jgi:hypothetical protein